MARKLSKIEMAQIVKLGKSWKPNEAIDGIISVLLSDNETHLTIDDTDENRDFLRLVGIVEDKTTSIPYFKSFDRSAWFGFAGATPFSDGSEPLIWENNQVVVVIDGNGVLISVVNDDDCQDFYTDHGSKEANVKAGVTLVKAFRSMEGKK